MERPESCGVGFWRKGGSAGELVDCFLAGADQSRPARSSIVSGDGEGLNRGHVGRNMTASVV